MTGSQHQWITNQLNDIASSIQYEASHVALSPGILANQNDNSKLGLKTAAHTDDASIVTSFTSMSYVSSIASSIQVDDALVAMIGIGKYGSGLHDLPGVSKDYQNVINSFVKVLKYKLLYQNSHNEIVYTNDMKIIDNENGNYKLRWNADEIELYVEQVRKHLVQNEHNGLIFVISSHGDTDKVIYDSKIETYSLDDIFNMFQQQWMQCLETYEELEVESYGLFQIPKIFFVDSCRGDYKAKITNTKSKNTNIQNTNEKNNAQGSESLPPNANDSKQSENSNDNTNTSKISDKNHNHSEIKTDVKENEQAEHSRTDNDNSKDDEKSARDIKKIEKFAFKGVSKVEAENYSAQLSNFSKLYANVEGCSVSDCSENGGLFLRCVCKVFQDTKFISKNDWNAIILKIREYTKRAATIDSKLFNFTQLVDGESTMERPVWFHARPMLKQVTIPEDDSKIDHDKVEEFKVVITNLSKTDNIAVLVQNREYRKDRTKLIDSLLSINNAEIDNQSLLEKNRYYVLKAKDEKSFRKTRDSCFVTVLKFSDGENEEVCDREKYDTDYLYYFEDMVYSMDALKPVCINKTKENLPKHFLKKRKYYQNCENAFKCDQCNKAYYVGYYCRKCKYFVCKGCCHSLIADDSAWN